MACTSPLATTRTRHYGLSALLRAALNIGTDHRVDDRRLSFYRKMFINRFFFFYFHTTGKMYFNKLLYDINGHIHGHASPG